MAVSFTLLKVWFFGFPLFICFVWMCEWFNVFLFLFVRLADFSMLYFAHSLNEISLTLVRTHTHTFFLLFSCNIAFGFSSLFNWFAGIKSTHRFSLVIFRIFFWFVLFSSRRFAIMMVMYLWLTISASCVYILFRVALIWNFHVDGVLFFVFVPGSYWIFIIPFTSNDMGIFV